ncbi:DUF4236 domain-containing protein [Pseudomonas azerbaijanorientalis]|uniref:DUF4236 domain-containing protein n=1 Tax=Pseudomonas azerbaijanorientalis TaxID=2842350 RepID=UPI001C3CED97|nr:DUF4236 domain-containing protein [Pseudomonas azerbaijanorientalis]
MLQYLLPIGLFGHQGKGKCKMPIRLRKSIKLPPGIRMNLSGSGVGWRLDPRGASIGIGKRGARLNSSFMGFSTGQKLSGPACSTKSPTAKPVPTEVSLAVTHHLGTEPVITEIADNFHQKASASDSSKTMSGEVLAVSGDSCRLEVLQVLMSCSG